MDRITSRKNEFIQYLRAYDGDDFLCIGDKMFEEAVKAGAEITSIVWKDIPGDCLCEKQCVVPSDLFDYVCPQKNSPGPLFTARIPVREEKPVRQALILENVQDPGNVGTVIRTANAFGIDCVYLLGECASLHNWKTIRASMGAVFYQKIIVNQLPDLPIYGAALDKKSVDITITNLSNCAVAIGSEGRGLSSELLARCEKKIVIPMSPNAESLNAAVAASIIAWEMKRG